MIKVLFFTLIFADSFGASALDCSKYNFSKSLCAARLKSNQDYFGPFYRDGNTFRTVGCREGMNRGSKNENCDSDKCEVISYINVCGVQSFTKDLLPVMAQGEETEIILMTLEKYPKIMDHLSPETNFWNEYFFSEEKIFYKNPPPSHLKVKLSLLDRGFVPEVPTYKAILEKSIARSSEKNPELLKQYESSKFKKEVVQAREDVIYISGLGKDSLAPSDKVVTEKEFSRIAGNYLNSSANAKDLLNKKVELVFLSRDLKMNPPCYSQTEISDVLSIKELTPQVEYFISSQIDCQNITRKEAVLNLIERLQDTNKLTRGLFDKLYTKLSKEGALTEREIMVLTKAVSLFSKEAALKLSLLEFEAIEKFTLDLKVEDCPVDSKAHQILLSLQQKIRNDQTEDYYKKLADPKVSYSELEKITSQNVINYAYTPKGSPTYYSILANLPESRFSKEE